MRAILFAFIVVLLSSCLPSRESSLKLAPTPPLSGGPGWAVVKGAYVRLKPSPSQSGTDLSHLRRGDVLEVTGRDLGSPKIPSDKGVWYRLKAEGAEGWAREVDLDVFSAKAQAEHAAQGYR
jgi:hypothetical protein